MNTMFIHYRNLSAKAFDLRGIKSLVAYSNFEEQTAFHKVHVRYMNSDKVEGSLKNKLEDRYPFIKIGGRWKVSIPKLFLYLLASRQLLAQFHDENMESVYKGIQNAQKYLDDVRELDKKLTPTDFDNLETYTEKQRELYENYLTEQLPLFRADR